MLNDLSATSNAVRVVAPPAGPVGPVGPAGPPGQNGTATLAAVWAPGAHTAKAGKKLKAGAYQLRLLYQGAAKSTTKVKVTR